MVGMPRWMKAALATLVTCCVSGCMTHLYAHRTLEGTPFRFDGLAQLHDGMTFEEVRGTLGSPLEVTDAGEISMWRYFERANPRWCDGGSTKAVPPEYSVEVVLVFRSGAVVIKKVRQVGSPVFP